MYMYIHFVHVPYVEAVWVEYKLSGDDAESCRILNLHPVEEANIPHHGHETNDRFVLDLSEEQYGHNEISKHS